MVEHPSYYPWSSYACNALGTDNLLITLKGLFHQHIDNKIIEDIRAATIKLGSWLVRVLRLKLNKKLEDRAKLKRQVEVGAL